MIIVAGCGYVGARVADLLHEAGHEVTGLTHSAESTARLAAHKPWCVETCDISSADSVRALAEKIGADQVVSVVHCASSGRGGADAYEHVYVNGARHLIAAFPDAHLLFTSSTSVYPQTDGSVVDESSDAEPARDTGRLLRDAENLVVQKGGTVARLAGIYGPARSFVLKNLLLGKAAIEGAEGQGRILNQIHREDAARAVVHLVLNKSAGIFNVVDDAPMTQRQCYEQLCPRFALPLPQDAPPDPGRKRGWTNKGVSNAKLRAAGFHLSHPSYPVALDSDPDLMPSIIAQIHEETPGVLARRRNVLLIGLMGSGKSSVGRIVACKLGFQFLDTDHLVSESAGKSIPQIFESEGEAGFRLRESAVLRSLMNREHCVIATGGGIITQSRNLPLLRHLGFAVWLEADTATLARRTASSTDRPLLKDEDPKLKLSRLLEVRQPLYKTAADLRIQTDELSQDETAYGIAESARLWFSS
jgi:shikimate kinase/nucleoside-diphosphate-sugar epimerase